MDFERKRGKETIEAEVLAIRSDTVNYFVLHFKQTITNKQTNRKIGKKTTATTAAAMTTVTK